MNLKRKNSRVYALLLFVITLIQANSAIAACTDEDITVSVSQGISLGSIVVPDAGSSSIGIAPSGVRTIPSNLSFGSTNAQNLGDQFQTAVLDITGFPDCKFRITVGLVPARVSNVQFLGVAGTTLNSSSSGAIGQLSSTGTATVHLGASVQVFSTDNNDISESFDIVVELIN